RAVGEGFVELVERGEERSPEALQTVRAVVEPMIEAGADRIVLGCTHYPFLTDTIAEVVGNRAVEIIDPAPAVARRAAWLLDQNNLRAESGNVASYDFLSAAGEEYEAVLAARANSLK
ncbi:MAG: aspartate/glutamate racemase family protein, partial [Tidjanibacter sp.]|nr:aspartate/glutamate racemase family protein [Tidjanibacter sp.]